MTGRQRLDGVSARKAVVTHVGTAVRSRVALVALLVLVGSAVSGVLAGAELESPGPLSEVHAALDDGSSCDSCHDDDFNVDGERCLVCHDRVAERIAQRRGLHREVTPADCGMCHGEHQGLDARLIELDPEDFDHGSETGFPLLGWHAEIAGDCSRCHPSRSFLEARPQCVSCHRDAHDGALGEDCSRCHTPERRFASASRAFHKQTLFPLEGRHLMVPCEKCHLDSVLEGTPTRCYDCHWIRRQDDPFRTQLGVECESCHRPTSWTAVAWDHASRVGYPLGGVHRTIDCEGCHQGLRFDGPISPDCYGCHTSDYRSTEDPEHALAGFPTDCEVCHRASDPSWNLGSFSHPYQLVGTHTTLECAACHGGGVYVGTPTECVGCHLEDYQGTVDPDHEAAGFPTDCQLCHRPTAWGDAEFAHPYQLVGNHATLGCSACHGNGVYAGTPTECVGCHLADYQGTESPDHQAAGFPTDCDACHSPTDADWRQAAYPHGVWPLVGAHQPLPCTACHGGGVYQGLPSACVACHLGDYQGTSDPDHEAAGFPTDCERCHQPTAWGDADFTHPYSLLGTHATLDCAACHGGGVYAGTPTECVGCHLEDYQGTESPDHQAAGFPTDCDACHSPADADWLQAAYPHGVWPLVGAHQPLPCTACHGGGVYQGLPSACVACHLGDYQGASDPDHQAAGFPTDCERCHQPTAWEDADFTHPYSLLGTHATLDCAACHGGGVYAGTPTECVSCHLEDYQGTESPDHQAAGFPTDCDACHSPADADWLQAAYPHGVWPLVGAHQPLPCTACHGGGVYQGLPSECVACHLGDYQGTTDPDHVAAGFPTYCERCHQPTAWGDADFTHGWELAGSHATLDCTACHGGGVYAGTPTECVGCHLGDYQGTTDPDHVAAGFPTDCQLCHQPTAWGDADFTHGWELAGSHATLDCAACHGGGVYAGTPTECVGCHLEDYQGTTDPDHVAAGFPTDCQLCHQPTVWTDADFTHTYPLLGTHATLDCAACHGGGVYAGTPTECVGCHLEDYQGTTDPDHVAAGFPTDCVYCHSAADTSWSQGQFDHVYFPITSGPHGAADCADCHVNPSSFAVFSCIDGGCHPQSRTDRDHSEVIGYVYDPMICYSCHPNGRTSVGRTRMVPSHAR